MPDNSWRPDWKDWKQYSKPDDMNDLQFGWELLRRNTEYQELYDQYVDAMEFCKVDCSFIGAGMAARLCIAIATRFCLKEPVDYRRQFATVKELKELAANIEYVWPLEVSDVKVETSIAVPPQMRGIGAVAIFVPVCWDEADQAKQIEALEKTLNKMRSERMYSLKSISESLEPNQVSSIAREGVNTLLSKADVSKLSEDELATLYWADLSCPEVGANRDQAKKWRLYLRRLDARLSDKAGDQRFGSILCQQKENKQDPDYDVLVSKLSDENDLSARKDACLSIDKTANKYSQSHFVHFLKRGAQTLLEGR